MKTTTTTPATTSYAVEIAAEKIDLDRFLKEMARILEVPPGRAKEIFQRIVEVEADRREASWERLGALRDDLEDEQPEPRRAY